jgi:hypothetical protein
LIERLYFDCRTGVEVEVEGREKMLREEGDRSRSLDSVLRETRSTYRRTLPRPHVRKDLQYGRKYGTLASAG